MIKIFRKFFAFSGQHRRTWYKAIGLEILRSIAGIAQFVALLLVFEHIFDATMTPQIAWLVFAIIAGSVVVQMCLHYVGYKLEMQACYHMLDDKRIEIGERMRYMPMGFFNRRSLGNLTALCTSMMDDLESLAGNMVVRILTGILNAVLLSLALLGADWLVGLIYLAVIAAMLLVNMHMLRVSRRFAPDHIVAQTKLVDAVLAYIRGMSVVKAFNLSERTDTLLADTIVETEKQNFLLEQKSIPSTIEQQVVLHLFSMVALACSIYWYLSGSMGLDVCVLVVICGFMVYNKLEVAGTLSFMLPTIDEDIDRIEDVSTTPLMDEEGWVETTKTNDLEFADVSFGYDGRTVIDDVSLTIPEGTACAIVDPSGSGKTTLVNLMMRFWDVDAGAVILGGEDVRSWKLDALMAHYAMVFQDVYLFGDTIENNIKFGRLDATHDEVVTVAKAARCHDFISALPQGYNTPVGEGMILVYAFTSCIHLRFFYKRRDNPSNCACFSTNNIVLPRRCGEGITTDYSAYLIELSLLRNSAYE